MDDWFEHLVRQAIGRAIVDAAQWVAAKGSQALTKYLSEVQIGKPISPKPLVVFTEKDEVAHTLRLVFRGDVKIATVEAFARVETVLDYQSVDLLHDPPIKIVDIPVALGDISYKVTVAGGIEPVAELALRFQREGGVLGAGGNLTLLPFPRLAAYGAFGDGKFVVSLDAKLPGGASIPLGPTGLAIWGAGGTFAHNFKPRLLEQDGFTVPAKPTAIHYVRWSRDTHPEDQWMPARVGETSTGIAVRAYLGTADRFIFTGVPVGIAFITPGALIIGGQGRIFKQEDFHGDFYAVIDFASGSVALSVGMSVEVKAPPAVGMKTLSGSGSDGHFLFLQRPDCMVLRYWPGGRPCKAGGPEGRSGDQSSVLTEGRGISSNQPSPHRVWCDDRHRRRV